MLLGCLLETLLEVSCVIRLFIRDIVGGSHVLLGCLLETLLEVSCVIRIGKRRTMIIFAKIYRFKYFFL